MYSNLVERCFNACCNDFTSKALSSKEVLFTITVVVLLPHCHRPCSSNHRFLGTLLSLDALTVPFPLPNAHIFNAMVQEQCVMNCTDKFLKHSERVGARFAEHNAGTCSASHACVSMMFTHAEFLYSTYAVLAQPCYTYIQI